MIVDEANFDFRRQYKALLRHHRFEENAHNDISKKTGISINTIKKYHDEPKRLPKAIHMLQIAKGFDISPEFFFTDYSVDQYFKFKKAAEILKTNFDDNLSQDEQVIICEFIISVGAWIRTNSAPSNTYTPPEVRKNAFKSLRNQARKMAGVPPLEGSQHL